MCEICDLLYAVKIRFIIFIDNPFLEKQYIVLFAYLKKIVFIECLVSYGL